MSTTENRTRVKVLKDSAILVAWVVGVAMAGIAMGFEAIWAPFFCAILFSIFNKDVKRIPEIIFGAVTGVWLAWGIVLTIGIVKPMTGDFIAISTVLFFGIYIIFCGGMVAPLLINQSTFVYLTVALATHLAKPPLELSGLIIIGGGILLAGEVLLLKMLSPRKSSFVTSDTESIRDKA